MQLDHLNSSAAVRGLLLDAAATVGTVPWHGAGALSCRYAASRIVTKNLRKLDGPPLYSERIAYAMPHKLSRLARETQCA